MWNAKLACLTLLAPVMSTVDMVMVWQDVQSCRASLESWRGFGLSGQRRDATLKVIVLNTQIHPWSPKTCLKSSQMKLDNHVVADNGRA